MVKPPTENLVENVVENSDFVPLEKSEINTKYRQSLGPCVAHYYYQTTIIGL